MISRSTKASRDLSARSLADGNSPASPPSNLASHSDHSEFGSLGAVALYPGGLGMTRPGSTVQIRADQISNNVNGPKTATEFFNTAAFTDAVGHFGSSRPGAIYGPGLQVWDMSLLRMFGLSND